MTQQQYKSELGVIESKIKKLYNKKIKMREQFLKENAQFGVGDKVVVIFDSFSLFNKAQPEKRIEAFISGVDDKYFSGTINYDFSKVKKDGTKSNQSAGIYGTYSRIELIEKAKTPSDK